MSRSIQVPNKSISELTELQNTNDGKIIVTTVKGHKMALLVKQNRLIAAQIISVSADDIGGIYIGRVQRYFSNINAFFVEIEPEKICFLPGKELSPGQQLKGGDTLPVQIVREAQKNKLPTISARISIANAYAAISLGNPKTGYSSKMSAEKKKEIRECLLEQNIIDTDGKLLVNGADEDKWWSSAVGMVVRTMAEGCDRDTFLNAVQDLIVRFRNLMRNAAHRMDIGCIYPAPPKYEAIIQQLAFPEEYRELVTDDMEAYEALQKLPQTTTDKSLRFYTDKQFSLAKLYALDTKLEEALKRLVWMKSGAYLVIDPTEAMTVIDVNSGKFDPSKHKSFEEMTYAVNQEAAKEVARQLRLRNLSGIILVDFINMSQKEQERELLHALTQSVRSDRRLTNIVDITPLGLVEITRQKVNMPLAEQLRTEQMRIGKE